MIKIGCSMIGPVFENKKEFSMQFDAFSANKGGKS